MRSRNAQQDSRSTLGKFFLGHRYFSDLKLYSVVNSFQRLTFHDILPKAKRYKVKFVLVKADGKILFEHDKSFP